MGKKMLLLAKGLNSQFKTAKGDHKMVLVGVDEMVRVTNRLIKLEEREAKRTAKKAAKKDPEVISVGDTVELVEGVRQWYMMQEGEQGTVADISKPEEHTYPYLVRHPNGSSRRYAREELVKVESR